MIDILLQYYLKLMQKIYDEENINIYLRIGSKPALI